MKVDKHPVGDTTEVHSKSLDFNEPNGFESSSSLPKQISSSSSSSSSDAVDDSDSSEMGSEEVLQDTLGHFDTTKINSTLEGDTIEIYDRESILYELANPENFGNIQTIERIHGRSSTGLEKLSENSEECRKLLTERLRETLKPIPDTLLHMLTGRIYPGDCGRPLDQKPDWLDMDKLRRGQKFAQDYDFSVTFAGMISFIAIFNFDDSLKPLIITGESGTPWTAFKRYLSTALRVRNWYTQDLWAKESAARKDIMVVRAKHLSIRRKLESSTHEEIDAASIIPDAWSPLHEILLKDFSETCKAPVIGQCPYLAERNNVRPKSMNQAEMAFTQWTFFGLMTSFPKRFGLHNASDEDLEAFCHLWQVIGYMIGIEDKYNFCRGTLEEIRQRNHDLVETWMKPNFREITPEWEHMLRCMFIGLTDVIPGISYETALLLLMDVLDLQMPRLHASISYKDWISYNFVKFHLNYTIKLPGMYGLSNSVITRAVDRAKNFTPKDLEAIRIKLSNHPMSSGTQTKQDI